MTEKTSGRKSFEGRIPEEVREHARAARQEIRAGIEAFLPPEALEHGRKARREMLLAWRSMIDAVLARMDEKKVN